MATATKSKTTTTKTTTTKKAPAKTTKKAVSERSVKTVVLDSAYATVGLTDTAVAVLKSLPAKAAELREEAPVKVKALAEPKLLAERAQAVRGQGKAVVLGLRTQAEQQLDTLAARGREVVGKVQNNAATKRALEQSRIARSQVKAAATSVRKAVGATGEAVETATEKVGTATV